MILTKNHTNEKERKIQIKIAALILKQAIKAEHNKKESNDLKVLK